MRAVSAVRQDPADPISCVEVGEVDLGPCPEGFASVRVEAATLNHHDVWALRGPALRADRVPMILGTDAAGVTDDGREVIVHAVIDEPDGWVSLLSERLPGTLAQQLHVPAQNLVDKPAGLSFDEAACLPTAYLTAYNMLFGTGRCLPGEHVLIQGAGGGVASAAILLAVAGGLEVTVTSRAEDRRERALALGAHHAVATGERLPARVDAVIETVGEATWPHSLRSVRNGGRIVVAGGTSGGSPSAELAQLYFRGVDVRGTLMGSSEQLDLLARMLAVTGVKPLIDQAFDLDEAPEALRRMADGQLFGKLVIHPQG